MNINQRQPLYYLFLLEIFGRQSVYSFLHFAISLWDSKRARLYERSLMFSCANLLVTGANAIKGISNFPAWKTVDFCYIFAESFRDFLCFVLFSQIFFVCFSNKRRPTWKTMKPSSLPHRHTKDIFDVIQNSFLCTPLSWRNALCAPKMCKLHI